MLPRQGMPRRAGKEVDVFAPAQVDRPYARQGMPGARDKRNALSWRDYALEFPVAADELAFDFDPVYLARRGASLLF